MSSKIIEQGSINMEYLDISFHISNDIIYEMFSMDDTI